MPLGTSPPTSGSSNSSSSSRSAAAMSASRTPPAAAPSGVSRTARIPASTAAGSPTSSGRRASSRAIADWSWHSRSVAAKSTASSTWCTNVPTRVPPGMSPRSDGTSRSAASSSDAFAADGGPSGASSSRSRASGSLVTTGSWVARGDPAVGRAAPAAVDFAVEARGRRARRSGGAGRCHRVSGPGSQRSTAMHPAAASPSRRNRSAASSSDGTSERGRTVPSSSRANARRLSGDVHVSRVPAHQMTAW